MFWCPQKVCTFVTVVGASVVGDAVIHQARVVGAGRVYCGRCVWGVVDHRLPGPSYCHRGPANVRLHCSTSPPSASLTTSLSLRPGAAGGQGVGDNTLTSPCKWIELLQLAMGLFVWRIYWQNICERGVGGSFVTEGLCYWRLK